MNVQNRQFISEYDRTDIASVIHLKGDRCLAEVFDKSDGEINEVPIADSFKKACQFLGLPGQSFVYIGLNNPDEEDEHQGYVLPKDEVKTILIRRMNADNSVVCDVLCDDDRLSCYDMVLAADDYKYFSEDGAVETSFKTNSPRINIVK